MGHGKKEQHHLKTTSIQTNKVKVERARQLAKTCSDTEVEMRDNYKDRKRQQKSKL
jgi:hypothetical protein